ncbi:MAG: hypothetical protein ACJ77K_12875 [Bacteroidia bacterium]
MGVFAYPFGIDIEKTELIFGSKDIELFEKIKKDPYFQNYDEQSGIEEELRQIIFDYVSKNNRQPTKSRLFGLIKAKDESGLDGEWHNYFYVLLSICSTTGKDLSRGDVFKWGNEWEQINELLKKSGSRFDLDRMVRYRKLFDTPFEEHEGCTNIYEKSEVEDFYTDFLKIEKDIETDSKDTLEFYSDFKNVIKYCKDNRLDLVTFTI